MMVNGGKISNDLFALSKSFDLCCFLYFVNSEKKDIRGIFLEDILLNFLLYICENFILLSTFWFLFLF